jgi:integrase
MAHLGLSMKSFVGTPLKYSKALRWQDSQVSSFWSRTISAYICRLKQRVRTKTQAENTSPLKASVILGPLPKSTGAAPPGAKSKIQVARGSAIDKAGIEDFRFHDLRHCFATKLVQRGVDLYKVQLLLGHKTPLMTQRYAHHYPESLREGVEALGRVEEKFYHNFSTIPSGPIRKESADER